MLDFIALAQECAPMVAPQTMVAIVRVESQFQPLAIGVNGGARLTRQPVNKGEAIVTAKWLIAHGYNIDLGLGQINCANLSRTGLSVEDAFDACKNLAAAASILYANYNTARAQVPTDQGALQAAFSIYNTGSMTKGFANGYIKKVLANASALQATPVPAVQPIPLASGKVSQKPAKARVQQATESTNVMKLNGAPIPAQQRVLVYGSEDEQGAMVYR
jgi:type IV secretion system protein VirB1